MLTPKQREAVEREGSLCVTAGAGTGKTKVLVDRYLRILERGAAPVQGILALTFTEKAAAEMRERVRKALMEQGKAKEDLLEDLHWASISTFHSFCARVLREFPLESEVDPDFQVLDEVQADLLVEGAFESLVYKATGGPTEEALVSLLTLTGTWRLRSYLLALYAKRGTAERAFAKLEGPDGAKAWWQAMRSEHRSILVQAMKQDKALLKALDDLNDLARRYSGDGDKGMVYLREASPYLEALDGELGDEDRLEATISLYQVKGQRNYGSQKNFGTDLERYRLAYGTLRERLGEVYDLEHELEPEGDAFITEASLFLFNLKLVFTSFNEAVARAKREKNALDFDDILLAARRLLEGYDDVRRTLAERYRYILVDEFQDTDKVQVDIVRLLLDGDRDKLFVVGDAKQSIYLFRQVDVSLFKEMQDFIRGELSGETVDLDVNHRSTAQVVGLVNTLFDRLMDREDRPWEFRYSRIAASEERRGDEGSVELLLVPESTEGVDDRMTQAEVVARKVEQVVREGGLKVYWEGRDRTAAPRPARFKDVTILLRARTNLRFYEKQLRDHGIPYHVHSGVGFFARQEITDIHNVLRFLNNPLDDVSLYGALRSPFFGLSDLDLFWVCEGSKGPLWSRLKARASSDPRSERCWRLLNQWVEASRRVPVSDLITMVLEGSGIFGVCSGLEGGRQMIANLEKLRALVRKAQSEGFFSLSDLTEMLRLRSEEDLKEGQAQLDMEGEDAVSVMTVHAAKGLEFPIVLVPELESPGMQEHELVCVDEKEGIGLKVPHPFTMEMRASALKRRQDRRSAEKELAERKRLFYVACTRAKDHLVLCGHGPDQRSLAKEGKDWMVWTWQGLGLGENDVKAGGKRLGEGEDTVNLQITMAVPTPVVRVEEPGPLAVPSDWPEWQPARSRPVEPAPRVVLRPSRGQELAMPLEEVKGFAISARTETPEMRGEIAHQVLQGKDATVVLVNFGQEDPRGEKARKLTEVRERFLSTPLMREAVVDRKEQGFEIVLDGRMCIGRMDRLVRTKDGQWYLIDFKTGMVSRSRAKEKVKEHASQMGIYRRAAESIVGHPVRSMIYFTDGGFFEEVR